MISRFPDEESLAEFRDVATRLVAAVLAERAWGEISTSHAIARSLAKPWSDELPLTKKLGKIFAKAGPEASADELAETLSEAPAFQSLVGKFGARIVRPRAFQTRVPDPPELRWPGLPDQLATVGDLAEWLDVTPTELDWLAGRCRDHEHRPDSWRHYHCRWMPKRRGPDRLIESSKPFLKSIQRKLLDELVGRIPLHDAAHGFRAGRSIRSFAEPHVGRLLVLRMDLADFFPSIRQARVASLFRSAGYSEEIARLLAGLCCHATPEAVLRSGRDVTWESKKRLRLAHLPQGAPTSPALSNAIAFRLDRRLSGLAASANARYTRYADDLAFSGNHDSDLARGSERFARHVAAIALEEGLTCAHRKTRVMRANQRQSVAGVVVNEKPNVNRALFDELKAILHRCERAGVVATAESNGQEPAEFLQRLRGRIAAVSQINENRGRRLRERLDQVEGRLA